jgi:sulfatase maturation enzyme AslB (radical SAM superfamily)
VRDVTEGIFLPAACKECAYKKVCPSCAAVTHSASRDPSKLEEGVCRYVKTFVRTFLELAENPDPTVPVGTNDSDTDPFVCL